MVFKISICIFSDNIEIDDKGLIGDFILHENLLNFKRIIFLSFYKKFFNFPSIYKYERKVAEISKDKSDDKHTENLLNSSSNKDSFPSIWKRSSQKIFP